MLFIPIDGLIDGVERAQDRNFSDLAKLMQADVQAQKNTEFFAGAAGREAAINVESQTQKLAAENLIPRLDEVAAGRSNAILGRSATRSLKGIYDQEKARILTPNVPELARVNADTQIANSTNANVNAREIIPQNQKVKLGRDKITLDLLPETRRNELLKLLGSQAKAEQVLELMNLDTNNRAIQLENSILQSEERIQTIPMQYQLKREDIANTQRRRLLQQSVTSASGLLVRSAEGISPAQSIQSAQNVRNGLVKSGILQSTDVISYNASQGGWIVQSNIQGSVTTTPLSSIIKEADSRLNPQRYRNADNRSKKSVDKKSVDKSTGSGRFGDRFGGVDSSSIIGSSAPTKPISDVPQPTPAYEKVSDVPQSTTTRLQQIQQQETGIDVGLLNRAKNGLQNDKLIYEKYRSLVQSMLDSRKIKIPYSKEMIEQEMLRTYYKELNNG